MQMTIILERYFDNPLRYKDKERLILFKEVWSTRAPNVLLFHTCCDLNDTSVYSSEFPDHRWVKQLWKRSPVWTCAQLTVLRRSVLEGEPQVTPVDIFNRDRNLQHSISQKKRKLMQMRWPRKKLRLENTLEVLNINKRHNYGSK